MRRDADSSGSGAGARTRTLAVLILAVIAGVVYLLSVFRAYPDFQRDFLTDPLAELHSLPPTFYVAVALLALSILACAAWRLRNMGLHMFLLLAFASSLWLTPYYLAGFVRHHDGPWHVGVAMQVPQVLAGDPVAFSEYASFYPGSFIYHYGVVNVLGIEPLTYIRVFPLLCLAAFVLLCYLLLARLFSPRVALLALLLAIPGLHYLQLHPSPHTIGALLLLTALLVLSRRGAINIVLYIILAGIVILTHPTSPVLLGVFVAAALVASVLFARRIGRAQLVLGAMAAVAFGGWYLVGHVGPFGAWGGEAGVAVGLGGGGWGVGQEFVTGSKFVYGDIYNLNRGVYFLYAALALLGILYALGRAYLDKRDIKAWILDLGGLRHGEAVAAISIPPLVILSFVLAETAHDLLETGLTYIILAASCVIASVVVRHRLLDRRGAYPALVVGVLFLTLTFPVVAYSIDAYTTVPASEGAGLEYLVEKGSLEGKSVAGGSLAELAIYGDPSLNQTTLVFKVSSWAWYMRDEDRLDVFVFRKTDYYYRAMRRDGSFEDNDFTRRLALVENSGYSKVYASPTFEVYSTEGARHLN